MTNGSAAVIIFQLSDSTPANNASKTTGLSTKTPIVLSRLFGFLLKME